mgnify:FL=1
MDAEWCYIVIYLIHSQQRQVDVYKEEAASVESAHQTQNGNGLFDFLLMIFIEDFPYTWNAENFAISASWDIWLLRMAQFFIFSVYQKKI